MKRIYPVGAHGHAPLQEILCQLGNLFPGNLLNSFKRVIATALLMTLAACNLPQTFVSQSPAPEKTPANLVALLFVKQNNLDNELRGEIYPIALLLNDHYLEMRLRQTSSPPQDF